MTKKTDTPAIRFKGFSDTWEQRKVGEVSESYSGGTPSVGVKEYYGGQIPFIRSAEINSEITELFLTEEGLKNSSARLVAVGDILYALYGATSGEVGRARLKGAINQAILAIKPHTDYDSEYLAQWLRKSKHSIIETYLQGGQGNLSGTIVKELSVDFPSLKEQKAIGDFFRQLDNLITLHQRKYEKLHNIKKSMLEKMFPKNGSNVPEIRFKGFTEAWEQRKLGEVMNVTSVKRIHQSDWTDYGIRFLRARDIVSAYKNEEPDDYLYISKEKYDEYSSISGKVSIGDMLVTGVGTIGVPYLVENSEPLYFKDGNIIWFQNEDKVFGKFLFYSFAGKSIQDFITESAGIGTVGTYTIESGKKTPISLPNKEEQERIGLFFANLDHLITLHQRELEKLQNIKKSMLEKMFV